MLHQRSIFQQTQQVHTTMRACQHSRLLRADNTVATHSLLVRRRAGTSLHRGLELCLQFPETVATSSFAATTRVTTPKGVDHYQTPARSITEDMRAFSLSLQAARLWPLATNTLLTAQYQQPVFVANHGHEINVANYGPLVTQAGSSHGVRRRRESSGTNSRPGLSGGPSRKHRR